MGEWKIITIKKIVLLKGVASLEEDIGFDNRLERNPGIHSLIMIEILMKFMINNKITIIHLMH